MNKKYTLVQVHYSNVKHQDYMAPFDHDNCPASQMEKPVKHLIEEISNLTMYQRAVQQCGLD